MVLPIQYYPTAQLSLPSHLPMGGCCPNNITSLHHSTSHLPTQEGAALTILLDCITQPPLFPWNGAAPFTVSFNLPSSYGMLLPPSLQHSTSHHPMGWCCLPHCITQYPIYPWEGFCPPALTTLTASLNLPSTQGRVLS